MSNIAIIGPSGIWGGVRALVEVGNHLTRRGHQITYVSTDNQPIQWLRCEFGQRPVADPGTGYEIALGSAIPTWALAEQLAPKAFGLFQMAEWRFAWKADEAARILADFDASKVEVLAISRWLYDEAAGRNKTVHQVRCGVNPYAFWPDPFPEGKRERMRVLIEGNSNNPAKDFDEMAIRAVRRLKLKGRDLDVWGFSQFPARFEFDRFWQQPDQDTIRKIYSSCDLLLKASAYEGRPGPDVEAMACGLPVCRAIDEGDDDLIDGETCYKTGYGNMGQFVANAEVLLDRPDERARLAANGRAYIRDEYDWPGAVDLIERAMTGAATQPQPRYDYELSEYDSMQAEITEWETPQAMFLGDWLKRHLQPNTVVDVGCGPGIYLVPFKPDATVLGIDGAPAAGKALDPHEFLQADLREDWKYAMARKDLGICVEVAEHLPPDRADYIVHLMTRLARTVFWSAARPGQQDTWGGTMHWNEQPKEWWLEKFREHGYDLHPLNDELQAALAANPHVRKVKWLLGNSMLLEARHA